MIWGNGFFVGKRFDNSSRVLNSNPSEGFKPSEGLNYYSNPTEDFKPR